MKESRRSFLKLLPAIPAGVSVTSIHVKEGKKVPLEKIPLERIGTIQIKKPSEIASSPFGIGCETLDRELWDPKEVYPWMDDLSVKWARLQTGWARVEREKGVYDWDWLDESVDGLVERGFDPFFNVGYGNSNYTKGDRGYYPLGNQEAEKGWNNFVTELAERYCEKIKYYEIWNEPNLKGFWKPGEVDAAKYVELVRKTVPLIREKCPEAVIVGGVLSRLPYTYIRALFEAGLADWIDIFSFHPYTTIPESAIGRIEALRSLIDQYDPSIEIWQGENGFPSEPNSTGFSGEGPWTENIQAKIMLRRLLTDCSLNIPMTLWFLIVDLHDYPKGSGNINYKGILRTKPEISKKVSFTALQNIGSLVNGKVRTTNSIIHIIDGDETDFEKKYELLGSGVLESIPNTMSTTLETASGKVLAYWSTVKAKDEIDSVPVHIFLWDWEKNGFEDPVLLDPLSGNIYEIPDYHSYNDHDKYRISQEAQVFHKLPIHDYPWLIMERGSVI